MAEFTLEEDVDRYVMQQLESLGLKQYLDKRLALYQGAIK